MPIYKDVKMDDANIPEIKDLAEGRRRKAVRDIVGGLYNLDSDWSSQRFAHEAEAIQVFRIFKEKHYKTEFGWYQGKEAEFKTCESVDEMLEQKPKGTIVFVRVYVPDWGGVTQPKEHATSR